MISLKSTVGAALAADAPLTALVGPRIYFARPPDFTTWPGAFVTYYESSVTPAMFADDEVHLWEITYQLDIWSKTSTTTIEAALEAVMVAQDFICDFSGDLPEVEEGSNEKINHRVMRFVTNRI